MAACNSTTKSFEYDETCASPDIESEYAMHLAKPCDTPKRMVEKTAQTRPFQRNQSLYYFPGTVCSKFGARLRELRHERNLTQDRMAVDFGIDRSFISDVERGRKSISLPLLEVIALGMNISLSDLLKDL